MLYSKCPKFLYYSIKSLSPRWYERLVF